MTIPALDPRPNSAAWFDVQQTTFSHDVIGRYVCNSWSEVSDQVARGGAPFDVVVIGAGMFGGYFAEKVYRHGASKGLRILVLDAGAYLFATHVQNLPQRLGGRIGGPDRATSQDVGFQNVVWRVPWISNEPFPGLAYCIGGRSLFWGGWSPRLTANDLANWPADVTTYLTGAAPARGAYSTTERETGVDPSTDYIVQASLYAKVRAALNAARPAVPTITDIAEAPLAVQGASPGPGIFPFDKFSSAPLLIDAIRDDVNVNAGRGDLSRRLFLVPNARVRRVNRTGTRVTALDLLVDGQSRAIPIGDKTDVVLANGTIESTRLALDGLGVGNSQFGSPRLGNLMAHLRSNITVRIKRTALGLVGAASEIETVAFIVRGEAAGRRFHHQITAASVQGPNPETVMWSMVPDIDLFDAAIANQDPTWVTFVFRGIGEMEGDRSLAPNPAMSWIDLSQQADDQGARRAYVNLVATAGDRAHWTAMDQAAFALAEGMAQGPGDIQYLTPGGWQAARPGPNPDGSGFWRDQLGSTHHEAGTLFMGDPGSSITDTSGKFHGIDNAYVAGPALFPTLGSANPSLTAIALARRTADAIIARHQ